MCECLTKVKCIANLIAIVPTAECDCILGIVEDVEGVASVPGSDIIVRRNISW